MRGFPGRYQPYGLFIFPFKVYSHCHHTSEQADSYPPVFSVVSSRVSMKGMELVEDMEEEAAELIKNGGYTKPLVAYIAGRGMPSGLRFSHASAIVEGGKGTAEGKAEALESVGAHVVNRPWDLIPTLQKVFKKEEN